MFIPKYTDWGRSVHPDYRNRALNMLADYFGYDFEELEAECLEYERIAEEEGESPVEGFDHFLFCAIEHDLSIEPRAIEA